MGSKKANHIAAVDNPLRLETVKMMHLTTVPLKGEVMDAVASGTHDLFFASGDEVFKISGTSNIDSSHNGVLGKLDKTTANGKQAENIDDEIVEGAVFRFRISWGTVSTSGPVNHIELVKRGMTSPLSEKFFEGLSKQLPKRT